MNRTMIVVCVIVTNVTICSAQSGPLATAASRAVAQPVPVRTARQNPSLYWGGVALSQFGLGLASWGLYLDQSAQTCPRCTTSSAHPIAWIATGGGFVVGGIIMAVIGGKRNEPTVTVTPAGVTVAQRVTF